MTMRSLLGLFYVLAMCVPAAAVDTDGDGLLDLMDVEGFNPSATGDVNFGRRGIQDLDGVNLLTNVEWITLAGNQIAGIEPADFEGLPNLQSLVLDGNHLTRVESGDFAGLANLQWLGLGSNRIAVLQRGGFHGLDNLESLGLDGNQVKTIEGGAFEGLSGLKALSLAHNQISGIETETFTGLESLQFLELTGNPLPNIDTGAFQGLSDLRWLDLEIAVLSDVEDGDFTGLTNLQRLHLGGNRISRLDRDAFSELKNLQILSLDHNQLTSIRDDTFNGLTDVYSLVLNHNNLSELNLTGATFSNLDYEGPCTLCPNGDDIDAPLMGFHVEGNDIVSLILDESTLSHGSFREIIGKTTSIADASLVGLTFSNSPPRNLNDLLGISTLKNVTVDQSLFRAYQSEFSEFASQDFTRLVVVPGLCDVNRDGECSASDIDDMTLSVRDGDHTEDDRNQLIHRPRPHGFGTYYGDANLDGQFRSDDLVAVLIAGQDGGVGNTGWSTGDWNADGEFTSDDLVLALADGGYEAGPRLAAVPEPSAIVLMLAAAISAMRTRGNLLQRMRRNA